MREEGTIYIIEHNSYDLQCITNYRYSFVSIVKGNSLTLSFGTIFDAVQHCKRSCTNRDETL